MRSFRYFGFLVLLCDLPVPLYWFILHPFSGFWRGHIRAAFWIAVLGAWIPGGIFLALARNLWLAPTSPTIVVAIIGVALVVADLFLLHRAGSDLGHMKLVGHAELTGKLELTTSGIYKYLRHPRYSGMVLAVVGACVLADTTWTWIVGAVWLVCVLVCILLEERELSHRFGPAYEEYCRAVPRFLPRFRSS